jgi:Arc/MetJ-type ribon-helix-helix transcriptional regulator
MVIIMPREGWVSIAISQKQADAIDEIVEGGKYTSRNEFVRAAVRYLLRLEKNDLDDVLLGKTHTSKIAEGASE